MRIAIFGGSFDPIHRGHLEPVEEACRALELERVIYVPTAQPPHKPQRRLVPAHCRFTMVELALLDRPWALASAFELTPGRPAYTVDTVEHFRELFPGSRLFLLLGADSLAGFHTWRRWRQIAAVAEIAILARPGWTAADLGPDVPLELRALAAGARVHRVENRPLEISSSRLRQQLEDGAPVDPGALPDLVLRYINKYALYRR